MKVPPVVSKRNHFDGAEEIVERGMMYIPDELKHPNLRKWLLRYTESVIKNVAADFGTAASRGIEQAANLLCDPTFYEHTRRKRFASIKKAKEDRAQQDWERIQRKHCPTREQIEQELRRIEQDLKYHNQKIADHEKRRQELLGMAPSSGAVVPPRLTQ